ncbi:patatin-like phospholipase family protein [Actinopolymorpha sp. NPDC004070]|uniref:patatin-like phospholipase family protein n=1 Tax=Actinopolymorpha sp. NPDC004070 TaxID=3154548 RepID=UPI0033A088AD
MSDERTRAEVRLGGHWRQVRAAMLLTALLLLVQWPMRHVVRSGDPTCATPARLSLLVDTGLICAYLLATWRAHGFVALVRPAGSMVRRRAFAGAVLVSAAACLDAVENVVLWQRFGGVPAAYGTCPSLSVGWLTVVWWVLWIGGLVLAGTALVTTRYGSHRRTPPLSPPSTPSTPSTTDGKPADPRTPADLTRHDRGRQIICCSGGGIRSAAFSLGALQALTDQGEYQRSSTVIGVSGGGYIAAAFHFLRRSLADEGRTSASEQPPYAMGSPELSRLRRHTHYLMPSLAVGVRAIMSLLYGAVVNLVLIGILIRAVAWVLGWAIAETSVVRGLGSPDAWTDFDGLPRWYWLGALAPLAIVVVLFLAEVLVDRFRVPPTWLRREGRALARLLLVPGIVSPLLLLGVPLVLVWANNLGPGPAGGHSGILGGLTDGVVGTANGVAGPQAANANAAVDSQFGFVTLAALGAAFIALARSAWKGIQTISAGVGPTLRRRILAWLRTRLVPWLGSALLVVGVLVVLLRWTAGYAASEEWRSRWWVAGVCAAILVATRIFTDATRTSLHPYYRERLSVAYLVGRGHSEREAERAYPTPLPYSKYAVSPDGGPQLVIVGSANAADADFIPPDRGCVPFVFDPELTGVAGDVTLPAEGLEPTAEYEVRADYHHRDVTLPGAVAISGAAFAPLTGRNNAGTRPMRLLFAVVNARLGVWLPNPYWGTTSPAAALARRCGELAERRRGEGRTGPLTRLASATAYAASIADKPGAHQLFREAFGRASMYDRRLYVTDGGHYDNLGLVEALRRRPARVIVIDASNDLEDSFAAVGSAIASARMDLGVDVSLDLRTLQRHGGERIGRGWARGRATYPEGGSADILLVKAVLAGDLCWDLETYALEHPDFPRHTTGDQLYGEFDFEAYRALGQTLTRDLLHQVEREHVVRTGNGPAAGNGPAGGVPTPNGPTDDVSPLRSG